MDAQRTGPTVETKAALFLDRGIDGDEYCWTEYNFKYGEDARESESYNVVLNGGLLRPLRRAS